MVKILCFYFLSMTFVKPNIIISKCLTFSPCRYNGGIISDEIIELLKPYVNFITVCPEVEIGLSTPRTPIRLTYKNKKIVLEDLDWEIDFTDKMNDFSQKYLEKLTNIDWFILKNKSPSCWIWWVKLYNSNPNIDDEFKNYWIFAKNVEFKFQMTPKEDEWRLKNYRIREEFLMKIFALSSFREVKKSKKVQFLNDFHTKNKFLLQSFNNVLWKRLWKILWDYNGQNLAETFQKYEETLYETFSKKLDKKPLINTIEHLMWFFKKTNSSQDKKFMLDSITLYREGRIPFTNLIFIIKTWAIRDNEQYILNQTILNPYPSELMLMSDSWKKINM